MGGVKGRKMRKRLARRVKAWDEHGKNPSSNPSNSSGTGHDMHKPGGKR